ncbi:MAG: MFS transporter [Candidatus Lokiarchaeota archaeon]|nr:MFS transporter [Candidatus Lokiarchaeota archaeon]
MNESKNQSLLVIYILSTIGDLSYSLLLTASIIYSSQLGANQSVTGFIGGGYGITYVIMPAIMGRFSDKISRKISLMIAVIGQISVSLFYLIFADSILELFLGQVALGAAYGFYWPSIEAFISEKTHDSAESHQIGMANFCVFWSIGFVVGPTLGAIFSDYNHIYSFIVVFALYTISFLLIFFMIPKDTKSLSDFEQEHKDSDYKEQKENKINPKNTESHKLVMIRILFSMLIYALLVKIANSYFTDYAVREDVLNWTGTTVGRISFLYSAGRTFYFILGRFHKGEFFKSSLKKISIGFLIMAILLIIIPFIKEPTVMSIVFFIFGLIVGLIYLGSLDLLIIHERKSKAGVAGLFESTIGFGAFLAPIIAGFLAEINPNLPFYSFAALVIFVFAMNMYLKKKAIKQAK